MGFKQVHSALTKIETSSQIVQQARSATYLCFKHIPSIYIMDTIKFDLENVNAIISKTKVCTHTHIHYSTVIYC